MKKIGRYLVVENNEEWSNGLEKRRGHYYFCHVEMVGDEELESINNFPLVLEYRTQDFYCPTYWIIDWQEWKLKQIATWTNEIQDKIKLIEYVSTLV